MEVNGTKTSTGVGMMSGEMSMEFSYENSSSQASAESMELAVSNYTKRHVQWEAEFKSIGKQEGELFSTQWKLIREEMGTMTRDFAMLKFNFEEMKRAHMHAHMKLMTNFSGREDQLEAEKNLRVAAEDKLKQEIQDLRRDLQFETKKREDDAEKTRGMFKPMLEPIEDSINIRCKDVPAIKDNVGALRTMVDRFSSQLDNIRDSIKQEVREREAGFDSLMKRLEDGVSRQIQPIHDKFDREFAPHKDELQRLKSAIADEKTERNIALQPLHEKVRDLAPHITEVPALRRVCEELEDTIIPRLTGQEQAINKASDGFAAGQTKLEGRLAAITTKVENDDAVRSAFMGDVEQTMAGFKSKMRSFASETVVQQARESIEKAVQDKFEKEALARENQHKAVQNQLAGQKALLESRIETIGKGQKDLETKVREETKQERGLDPIHAQKTDDLAKQVRDLQNRIPDAPTNDTVLYPHEDQIAFIEEFFQDTAERFLGGLQRRKTREPRALMTTHVRSFGLSNFGNSEAGTSEVTITPAKSEVTITPAKSEVTITPTVTITEKKNTEEKKEDEKKTPELDEESKQKLTKVLGGNKVALVMKPDSPDNKKDGATEEAFEAKLDLKEPIDFKPVHHGNTVTAEFKDESKVKTILGDVAEVLKIYPKAVLLVEGHTATPPEKVDKWAHDLAQARAEKVKSTIVSCGIDASRLNTIGLPGNKGSGKHDTVLKITSF